MSSAFVPAASFARSASQNGMTCAFQRPSLGTAFVSRRAKLSAARSARPNTSRTPVPRCGLDALPLAELAWANYAIGGTEVALNAFNFLMVVRIILSWYPATRLQEQPWIFVAVPTEPLLAAMRKVVKPVGGVDISPIVWFAIGSFLHEILVGQQGLLVLLKKYY